MKEKMMKSKPRALELADQCDQEDAFEVACARELRRLLVENQQLRKWVQELTAAQNATK